MINSLERFDCKPPKQLPQVKEKINIDEALAQKLFYQFPWYWRILIPMMKAGLTMEDLAKHAGITKDHLLRIYKKEVKDIKKKILNKEI
jgi:AraC-like DNA-binding protein